MNITTRRSLLQELVERMEADDISVAVETLIDDAVDAERSGTDVQVELARENSLPGTIKDLYADQDQTILEIEYFVSMIGDYLEDIDIDHIDLTDMVSLLTTIDPNSYRAWDYEDMPF